MGQCSGRGECRAFNGEDLGNPVLFCACDRDYADPECRTKRKSQTTAYLLSLFGGILGLDRFYLGFAMSGALKLISIGGFGFWWLADIVYIGSGPVYASKYRVSPNLPHWAYSLSTILFAILIGLGLAYWTTRRSIARKRRFLQHGGEDQHGNLLAHVVANGYQSTT